MRRVWTDRGAGALLIGLFVLAIGFFAPLDGARAQGFALALEKTADTDHYTEVNQVITYTYVVTNSGSENFQSFANVEVNDDLIGSVCSLTMPFNSGEQQTCTATYTITDADVANGSVTNTATASGDTCGECTFVESDPASVTINYVGTPSWTLTKTPTPTTYSGAGQQIDYSYVLTNTGNVAITGIQVSDDKTETVSCPATSLAVGDNMDCTASYFTTAADVETRSVTNHAVANGTPASGTLAQATATATVRFAAPPAGSITIVKNTTGGDDSFSFTSTVAGATAFGLTTTGGTASRSFAGLTPATYTFAEVNLPKGWRLEDLTCSGDAGGDPTTVNVAAGTASVGLDGGEAITCTFTNAFGDADATSNDIKAFLSHRERLLADGPDRTRIFRRIPGYLWGNGSGDDGTAPPGQPVALMANGDDGAMQMSVATSLLQLSQAYAQARGVKELPMPSFDVWVEAHFSAFDDSADGRDIDGHFGVAYVGVDYLVTPSVLVGALAQFDWTGEHADGGVSADGFGAMAGPYISARLAQNLFFTARVAYGGSENSIDPFGLYQDDFTTDRWLASAQLTGNWNFGNWRVTPTAEVTYIQENQQSYTDSRGVFIPDQTVSLGRFSFGPELAYRYLADNGTVLEPLISMTALWDFDNAGEVVSGLSASNDELHAAFKAGVMTRMTGGAAFKVVGTYDGLGSSGYDAFGGQAWVSIPLR